MVKARKSLLLYQWWRGTEFIYPPTSLPFYSVFALCDFRLASQLWVDTYLSLFAVALLALALTLKDDRGYAFRLDFSSASSNVISASNTDAMGAE